MFTEEGTAACTARHLPELLVNPGIFSHNGLPSIFKRLVFLKKTWLVSILVRVEVVREKVVGGISGRARRKPCLLCGWPGGVSGAAGPCGPHGPHGPRASQHPLPAARCCRFPGKSDTNCACSEIEEPDNFKNSPRWAPSMKRSIKNYLANFFF